MQTSGKTTTERWRQVRDNPRYIISDQGHLKDTQRNRFVLPTKSRYVQIIINNKYTYRTLARLLLEAFTPVETHTKRIDYINGDKNDIRLDNLKWHQNRTYEEILAYQREYENHKNKMLREGIIPTKTPNKSRIAIYQDWNEQLYHQLEKDLPQWIKKAIRKLIEMNKETLNEGEIHSGHETSE